MPFDVRQFFDVFAHYNATIWPTQIAAYLLGASTLALIWRGGSAGTRAVWLILALMWAWNGVAYHILHFSRINPLAYGFGALFVLQAFLFAAAGLGKVAPAVRFRQGVVGVMAGGLILYSMIVYPLLGLGAWRSVDANPAFGVAPCPTTIFTLGVLMSTHIQRLWRLAFIPIVWAAIGSSAALLLDVREDLGLAVAAAIMIGVMAHDLTVNSAKGITP